MNFSMRLLLNISIRNNIMNKIYLTILILFSSLIVEAQGVRMNLTGDAKDFDNKYVRIDLVKGANQTGGAWYPQSFNLDSSFHLDFTLELGWWKQAEGFAIVLHNDSIPIGAGNEQLGVPSSGNSFIVEFDLQESGTKQDLSTPHSAFFQNGSLTHDGNNLLQNTTYASSLSNQENMRLYWNSETQTFEIQRVNCSDKSISYKGDLKNNIFGGNPKIFIGYTASTSAIPDSVELWLHYNSVGISKNQTICLGEEVKLYAYNNSNVTWDSNGEPYKVLEGTYEIITQPKNSTYYKITNNGPCGVNEDSVWVEVLDTLSLSTEVIKNENEDKADIILTIEGGESPYGIEWLLPDLTTNTKQDLIDVTTPGLYQVSVTNKNQCSRNLEVDLILNPKEVEVEESDEIAAKGQDYFSPNGDSEDDFIRISVKGQSQILSFQGRILRTMNYGDLWDGTSDNGELMPSGVYIVKGEEGKQVITILR